MKLTPFILFLIILFVLVLSVVLNKWLPLNILSFNEGFSSFYETSASGNSMIIPQYSSTVKVFKIYDNLYFDQKNGNLIIINGETYSGTIDSSGASILNVGVIQRVPTSLLTYSTSYDSNRKIIPTVDSKIITSTVTTAYSSWKFEASPYQVFYMPWNDSTFIQIMDLSNDVPICASLFGSGGVNSNYTYQSSDIPSPMPTVYGGADTTPKNQFISEPIYDASQQIYAISDYVRFDTKDGDLILQTGSGASRQLTVYKGSDIANGTAVAKPYTSPTSPAKTTSSDVYEKSYAPFLTSRSFKPFMVIDTMGKNLVLYMPMAQKTLIALISVDSNNTSIYNLRNVVRFNPVVSGGVETANIIDTMDSKPTTDTTARPRSNSCDNDLDKHDRAKAPSLDSIISDYYKQYWYSSSNSANVNQYSDDFMLKTQMIPPICPACPACPSTTTCTNCGGNGGAGLSNSHYDSSANRWQGHGNTVGGIADGVGDVAGGALRGAGSVAGGALLGAGAVVGGVAQGAGAVVGGVAQGAGAVVGGAGNAVGGIAGGIGSAIGGLGQPTNVQNISQGYGQGSSQGYGQGSSPGSDQTRVGYYNSQTQNMTGGNYKGFIDPYSYNGALSSKGGDPLPVTTDFSRFGR